ncbi:uncharacterized protein LOC128211950 [Mya arenaria]|uniref:uncharacterized protein LOC128211950 n=1 Tax=Mya arenaria TaxID=6604 RepID=UPI0022E51EFC|nr:uncharacterized protein LOC128211950 [Mya arenaria]
MCVALTGTLSMLGAVSFVLAALVCAAVGENAATFDDDLHLEEHETGGRLRLQSRGKLAEIVDLDQIPNIKRVLCRGGKILVRLEDGGQGDVAWSAGALVVGSPRWNCTHNSLKPHSRTIYARIADIRRPKDRVIEIHTSDAGPLDMFEQADIRVEYAQGELRPSRHRRYLSNPLRTALNAVNYNASFTRNVPFNSLGDDSAYASVNLYKRTGRHEPEVDTNPAVPQDDKDFLFRCYNCHGYSHVSYYMELKIYKVNNKPVIKKYVMEMDINSKIKHEYNLTTDKEISLTKYGVVMKNETMPIFEVPLATFKTFAPIMLTVNSSSQGNIFLKAVAKEATNYEGSFELNGRTVISQRFEEGATPENEASVYNWTVVSGYQQVDTNHTFNTSWAFHQNLTLTPTISWGQKDINMNLGPPVQLSIRPTVNVVSGSNTVTRCDKVKVTVDSNVSVAETDFSVDAFGIHIWNVKVMNGLSRRFSPLEQSLSTDCHADCHAPGFEKNADVTMEDACGQPEGKIVRGDERFSSLYQLWGDFIMFAVEEGENATWCGTPGRACVDCRQHVVGDDVASVCADRLVSTELAATLTHLAKFVKAEWPDRKLYVKEAFDEPTSDFPDGRHGNESVFYEGRGIEVAITKPNAFDPVALETDENILQRLSELSVCSNFAYVKQRDGGVGACVDPRVKMERSKRSLVSRTRRSGHVEHTMVEDLLTRLGAAVRSGPPTNMSLVSPLGVGERYPAGETMDVACGAATGPVTQDDTPRFRRLVEYPLNDTNLEFEPEGLSSKWCGVETRRCLADCRKSTGDIDDHWRWCGTRTMHMRLAARLKRLITILTDTVIVEKALSMDDSDGSASQFKEGRAARLSLKPGAAVSVSVFTQYAILAGFDFVRRVSANTVEVCVKVQDGIQTHLAQFPATNLISVPLPLGEEDEYDWPEPLKNESRKPLLFDVSTSDDEIAEHFKLHHFTSPGKRYIRLDAVLVSILDLAYEDYPGGFYVISGSGYRPRSVNLDNIATRHDQETLRFEMGQALELKPNMPPTEDNLFKLAVSLIRISKGVRLQQLGIGLGCKADRLYVELRPLRDDTALVVEAWDSGNMPLYRRLKELQDMIADGGSVVTARPDPVICNTPKLGSQYFYFNFDLDQEGHCWSTKDEFCVMTSESRYNVSVVLQRRLTSAAGTGKLPRKDIMPEIEACIVNTCGGCPSAGLVWKEKVLTCSRMILRFLERASVPFQPLLDKVSIFNTENHESAVHSLACHDGRVCVENTQIYSLLMPVNTATYSVNNTEELLFGGADNPSPLLEIVEQELAWRAVGEVDVFLESAKDVNSLRNTIQILMMYNKNVTKITFHVDPDADEDDVIVTLQRKVEQWVSGVCPDWSRIVTTPYTMVKIPHDRKRRSMERSKDRNQMTLAMKNWEIDWMLRS